MSLQTRPIPPIPDLTAQVAHRAFRKGNVYMQMRDVLGTFFTNDQFADLFQWDRATTIYESAIENLEFADAQSPIEDMEDPVYRASLTAYTEGTLLVMSDETAQWGQSIRTPPQTTEFIARMTKAAEKYKGVPEPSQQEPPPQANP